MPYIEKKIYAGRYLEVTRYHIPERKNTSARADKENPTREVQQALNNKNSIKYLTWLMNTNFNVNDLFSTLTHKDKKITEAEAKRQLDNFKRRAKAFCKKNGRPDFKYISVTETTEKREGVHHHMVCNSLSFDEVEKLWGQGRTKSSKLEFEDNGLERLARYFTKEEKNKNCKKWSRSQNLKRPKITKKILKRPPSNKTPKPLKGYRLVTVAITDNFFTGVSQYIQMVKINDCT